MCYFILHTNITEYYVLDMETSALEVYLPSSLLCLMKIALLLPLFCIWKLKSLEVSRQVTGARI